MLQGKSIIDLSDSKARRPIFIKCKNIKNNYIYNYNILKLFKVECLKFNVDLLICLFGYLMLAERSLCDLCEKL